MTPSDIARSVSVQPLRAFMPIERRVHLPEDHRETCFEIDSLEHHPSRSHHFCPQSTNLSIVGRSRVNFPGSKGRTRSRRRQASGNRAIEIRGEEFRRATRSRQQVNRIPWRDVERAEERSFLHKLYDDTAAGARREPVSECSVPRRGTSLLPANWRKLSWRSRAPLPSAGTCGGEEVRSHAPRKGHEGTSERVRATPENL